MILLRADADPALGGGHFFRCLAVASFADDARLVVSATMDEGFRAHADAAGVELLEVQSDDMAELASFEADAIVLDGYQYDASDVAALRTSFEGRIAFIDDNGDRDLEGVDLVINPNVHAADVDYAWRAETHFLLGPRYALLRPIFAARRREDLPRDPWRVFVCLGGSDPTGATEVVVDALTGRGLDVDVVVGPATATERAWPGDVRVHRNVRDPSELMARASVAVTAAGGLTWELACLGTPCVQMVTADNQSTIASTMSSLGVTELLGRSDDVDAAAVRRAVVGLLEDDERRDAMSRRALALVDGLGARRVADALARGDGSFSIRRATAFDVRNVWLINNQPSVRATSISEASIPYDAHRRWYDGKLADDACLLLVVEVDGAVAGTLRFDGMDADESVVSVAIDARFRGRGLGSRVIDEGSALALAGARAIVALVRPDNIASLRAFEKAGYVREGEEEQQGVRLARLVRRR